MKFNRNDLIVNSGDPIAATSAEIEQSPVLRRATPSIAWKHGGELTRRVLEKMPITGKYRHVSIDTKVSYLMNGWSPSIPGWHTDGVPRGKSLSSTSKDLPNIQAQENMQSPLYHLVVLGVNPTLFIRERNIEVPVPSEPSRELYSDMTSFLDASTLTKYEIELGKIYSWDWWELHAAQWSKDSGWRYLMRVTESNQIEPNVDLNEVFRSQNQVYVNGSEVGW